MNVLVNFCLNWLIVLNKEGKMDILIGKIEYEREYGIL